MKGFFRILVIVALPAMGGSTVSLFADPMSEGYSAHQKGDYPLAVEKFNAAQLQDSTDGRVAFNLGAAYHQLGKYPEAEKSLKHALTLATEQQNLAEIHYNLGNNHFRMGKLEEAIKSYQEAIKLNPTDEEAKYNLEFVQREIKRRLDEMKKQQDNKQQSSDSKGKEDPKNETGNPADNQGQDKSGTGGKSEDQKGKEGSDPKKPGEPQKGEEKAPPPQSKGNGSDTQSVKKEEQKPGENSPGDPGKSKGDGKNEEEKNSGKNGTPEGETKNIPAREGELTDSEAERWFQKLSENRRDFLRNQVKGKGAGYRAEKDW